MRTYFSIYVRELARWKTWFSQALGIFFGLAAMLSTIGTPPARAWQYWIFACLAGGLVVPLFAPSFQPYLSNGFRNVKVGLTLCWYLLCTALDISAETILFGSLAMLVSYYYLVVYTKGRPLHLLAWKVIEYTGTVRIFKKTRYTFVFYAAICTINAFLSFQNGFHSVNFTICIFSAAILCSIVIRFIQGRF
jgi:hypothetical protein